MLNIQNDSIEIKKHPFKIKLYKTLNEYYISISKPISKGSDCLPKFDVNGTDKEIVLPNESSYREMLEVINHVESFGSLDRKFEYIDTSNITLKWTAENDHDHFSPLTRITRKISESQQLDPISNDWLRNTISHKNQLGDLYFPFSFYRDGKNLFYSMRYQSSFCTFYMMLEYFFNEKGWGIANDAYKRKKCLNSSLDKTLESIKKYPLHYQWLSSELLKKGKSYNIDGLLFLINRYRDNLSHANDKSKNRNVFNEHGYFSLSYIAMMICLFVSIKKRMLPFVHPSEISGFLDR
ncbi:hypothetical protein DBR11_20965 [Pedobacter sp. HMWF019]|nr:hypothetical protein DBR11_20965 [Pedobacter sp. HMWF019]